jgi:hypothetical protein
MLFLTNNATEAMTQMHNRLTKMEQLNKELLNKLESIQGSGLNLLIRLKSHAEKPSIQHKTKMT